MKLSILKNDTLKQITEFFLISIKAVAILLIAYFLFSTLFAITLM